MGQPKNRKQYGRFVVTAARCVGEARRRVTFDVEIDLDELNRLGLKASYNKTRKAHDGPVYVKATYVEDAAKAVFSAVLFLFVATLGARAQMPEAPKPHRITVERTLVVAEIGLRVGDAITTHNYLTNPCHCMKELDPIAPKSGAWGKQIAFQGGVALAVIEGSAMLRRHGHAKLARALLIADVTDEGIAVVNNATLPGRTIKSRR